MKVIVVGGGAAGIAAAYTLLDGGAEVLLLEARNRYGGRAVTASTIPNFSFDMGPQYIQDAATNPWSKIATKLQFETVPERSSAFLRSWSAADGWKDRNDRAGNVGTEVDGIATAFAANKELLNMPVAYQPAPITDDQLFGFATSPYGPFTESAELWQYLAADHGREKEEKSTANAFVKKGLGTLIRAYGDQLKQKYPNKFTQSFGAVVTRVDRRVNDVRITTQSGRMETSDACLVTIPVSRMADGSVTFNPALPNAHLSALEHLKLGSYKKLALALAKIPKSIAIDTNYYVVQRNPQGVWQYYRLSHYPNVLVAHAAGDFARALDNKPDERVVKMLTQTLSQAYPNVDDEIVVTASALTNWTNDAYAGGAYSYTEPKFTGFAGLPGVFNTAASFNGLTPAQGDTVRSNKTAYNARLRLGQSIDHLWIAGEATSEDAYGTIAGAYDEGVRAATEILEYAAKPKKRR